MRLKPTKIVTILLLTAFLVTSLGSIFGCISCDSGCLSDIHIGNHTDNHTDNHVDVHTDYHFDVHVDVHVDNHIVTLDQHLSGSDDSCIDSPLQLSNGIVEENESINWHSSLVISSTNDRLTDIKIITFVVSNSPLKFPPRISQTILAHRTVVILT